MLLGTLTNTRQARLVTAAALVVAAGITAALGLAILTALLLHAAVSIALIGRALVKDQ